MQNPKSKIAIVGGGVLGLTLALQFAKRGDVVTVFDSASEIGGLASVWNFGGAVWDKHYHVTLLSDLRLRELLREIGLEDELEWRTTRTGFYTNGELFSMSNSVEFLRFPPLDLVSKFRLGATIFYASKLKDVDKLEQILVADWLTKLSGKRTFEKMWLPLLRAKLGESYRETSAAFIWATIARMYAARKSGLKREMFGYVRGGYPNVFDKLKQHLEKIGVKIVLNSKVKSIEKFDGETTIIFEDSQTETFDKVILTTPANVAARLCPQLSDVEKSKLNAIRYQGIVCASVLLKNSLSDFYVTNITDDAPFTAIIEMTALVDKSQFGGNALIYLPKYVAPDDEMFDKSDDEIRETFVAALEKMHAHFDRRDVLEFKISRVRQVFALSTLDYSNNLPPMKTSLETVFVVNSAHIVHGTLNVNETIQLAENAFDVVES
ncbi:MAG: NAD(P)/FAD-dependent oxidoreductase [Pyrinomonadaceae bacterium]|nr:NAD(P)/FAD-dependent oxidoreductase [Pyrinomonadaceae bacterium]